MRKSYSETQFTDVPWAATAPSHWQDTKFKFLLTEKKKIQNLDLPAGSISFGTVVEKDSEKLMEETLAAYQELLEGEFIINPLNLNFDLKSLRTALSDKDVVVSSGYIIAKSTGVADKGFLRWLLHQFDVSHMKTLGAGIRQTINFGDIANSKVILPSTAEQRYIAAYLNSETQRIDGLIDEKQRFIDLLKEKRQALISHFVTKGLDDNVPMKDSGVEWIGEVPEHWDILLLKRLVSTRKGIAFKSDDFVDDLGTAVVKASDIKQQTILTPEVYLPNDYSQQYPKGVLRKKEIILSTVGSGPEVKNSAVGQVGMVPDHLDGALLNQNTVVFSPQHEMVDPYYLFYLVQTAAYRVHLDLAAHGTANQASINVSDMLNFTACLPPLEIQKLIVQKLERELESHSSLIRETEVSIGLLREHRTALISAAVTGKIDVRGMVDTKGGAA